MGKGVHTGRATLKLLITTSAVLLASAALVFLWAAPMENAASVKTALAEKAAPADNAAPASAAAPMKIEAGLTAQVGLVSPVGSGPATDLSSAELSDDKLSAAVRKNLRASLGTINFIRNDGQWDESVLDRGLSLTGSVIVEHDGLRIITGQGMDEQTGERSDHVWKLWFENSPGVEKVVPQHWAVTKHNYFYGEDVKVSDVPAARELLLEDVYPGIDLRLYGQEESKLEFDWIVEPGADSRQIKLRAEGLDGLELASSEELPLSLPKGDISMEIPEAYQIDDGERVAVQASIETEGDLIAYHVEGSINPDLPLVIDPTLEWGAFF